MTLDEIRVKGIQYTDGTCPIKSCDGDVGYVQVEFSNGAKVSFIPSELYFAYICGEGSELESGADVMAGTTRLRRVKDPAKGRGDF